MSRATDDKIVFGINLSHDTACAAVVGGEVVVAIAEERLCRVKHCTGVTQFGKIIPYRAIRYCCEALGIPPSEVDLFVVNSCRGNARDKLAEQLVGIPDERVADLPHPGHHLAHAYSTLYCSPFDEAAVIVVDTNGSFVDRPGRAPDALELARKEHFSAYHGGGDGVDLVLQDWVGPGEVSIGELYCIFSAALQLTARDGPYGFDCPLSAGGKLMGLACYDRGRTPPPDLFALDGDGRLSIALARVVEHLAQRGFVTEHAGRAELERIFGFEMRELVTFERRQDSLDQTRYIELAGEAQRLLEQALLAIGRRVYEQTGAKQLCLAGGNALNVTACTRLLEELPFERLFVQPAANDAGNAIGAGLYGYRELLGGRRRPYVGETYDTCRGRRYSSGDVARAVLRRGAREAVRARALSNMQQKVDALLPRLLEGKIVGVFEGRSEFGPRALGHRSLLALPREASMRERMNRLKHREWYRPVAPAVLVEDFATYFEAPYDEAPYMTLSARCTAAAREHAPAIVHVDNTARPQTVRAEQAPLLHALLVALGRETGVPILVNTSLNVDGEPIIETPDDAISTLLGAPLLDCILVEDFLLERRAETDVGEGDEVDEVDEADGEVSRGAGDAGHSERVA